MTPTDLSRIVSSLSVSGFSHLLEELSTGPLLEEKEYAFHSLKTAKRIMALLYKWLRFHPAIKTRTTLRLDETTAILKIIPKSIREKRGRKPNVY